MFPYMTLVLTLDQYLSLVNFMSIMLNNMDIRVWWSECKGDSKKLRKKEKKKREDFNKHVLHLIKSN